MIIYVPTPPEAAFSFTPAQMARLDPRYAAMDAWPSDPTRLVQDSALLLGAYLTVQVGARVWEGRPDHADPIPHLTESDWAAQLALTDHRADACRPSALPGRFEARTGLVYTFGRQVIRTFRLSDDIDRLELEFLQGDGFPGIHLIRGARLTASGQLHLWRTELTRVPSR